MRNVSFRRSLMVAVLAPLAACGPDERGASAPTAAQQTTAAPAAVTPVVQPRQLSLTPVAAGNQPAGAARTVTVQPVAAGERLDLQPVTQ
jgi:hypothetical protein